MLPWGEMRKNDFSNINFIHQLQPQKTLKNKQKKDTIPVASGATIDQTESEHMEFNILRAAIG